MKGKVSGFDIVMRRVQNVSFFLGGVRGLMQVV